MISEEQTIVSGTADRRNTEENIVDVKWITMCILLEQGYEMMRQRLHLFYMTVLNC